MFFSFSFPICSVPLSSTDVTVVFKGKDRLTFQWTAPDNIGPPVYRVALNSSFWAYNQSLTLVNKTTHTFEGLTSGSMYQFQVQTVTAEAQSPPKTIFSFTGEDLSHEAWVFTLL